MGIGRRIRQARENLQLTQKDLGDIIGVTGSAVTNYENEVSHPKETVMYKLIEALKVDANFLFQDCVNMKTPPTGSDGGRIGKDLSFSAIEVATAYETALPKDKRAVRSILELAPLEEDEAETLQANKPETV